MSKILKYIRCQLEVAANLEQIDQFIGTRLRAPFHDEVPQLHHFFLLQYKIIITDIKFPIQDLRCSEFETFM